MGIFSITVPMVYQRYFLKWNYLYVFLFAQSLYVIAESINIILTLGYNKSVGIPNFVLYVIGGSFAFVFEHGFTMFVSLIIVSKLTPPGIESTMYSLAVTIIVMNQFVFRIIMGVIINKCFVHVTKENIQTQYIYLKFVTVLTPFIPLIYMWYLIPTSKEVNDVQEQYVAQTN